MLQLLAKQNLNQRSNKNSSQGFFRANNFLSVLTQLKKILTATGKTFFDFSSQENFWLKPSVTEFNLCPSCCCGWWCSSCCCFVAVVVNKIFNLSGLALKLQIDRWAALIVISLTYLKENKSRYLTFDSRSKHSDSY